MSRRARPTLRVLREELADEWGDAFTRRALEAGEITAAQPLSALPHPILRKAAESFGDDPSQDSFVGAISSVRSETLLEIKQGQWRAGVWIDDVACWVVTAGLAKGDHKDRDDFYQRLRRIEESGRVTDLLPGRQDRELLKKERTHALISSWQLRNQALITKAVDSVQRGGITAFTIGSPLPDAAEDDIFASVELTVTINDEPDDHYEDVVVELTFSDRWKASRLVWPLTTQLLATINPPEQEWDVGGGLYSTLLEIGALSARLAELRDLTSRHEVGTSEPGGNAHYAHARNLAEQTVEGRAARAICGVYFVPRRDTASLTICPPCSALMKEIPHG
ncbi:DUF3039 domain-containing protein [Brachybacterium sp. AOP43-C2-M15]|uniref:DUF3039 domain-containing protein n=1 Tax=Brachybacterium sp. AOP43-C2-M15 TaxID=3457661 RepID=UPI00403377D2